MIAHVLAIPKARALDLAEQLTHIVLYGLLVYRLFPSEITWESWYPLILLASEGMAAILLILRRRTEQISLNVADWLIAATATLAVLCVGKGGTPIALMPALLLMLSGLCIHVAAKLTLRRSFGLVAAHRGLILGGVYARVRHPMYAGYLLSHIGFLLWAPTLWNVAVYAVAWTCMWIRMNAEERVLGQDPDYRAYMDRVRYRLIPGLY
jgi:protein-S-isoprenylcysteine O-methyltransferase Ste14